jgi:hypothetical protein
MLTHVNMVKQNMNTNQIVEMVRKTMNLYPHSEVATINRPFVKDNRLFMEYLEE